MKQKLRIHVTMFDFMKGLGMAAVLVVHSMPWDIENNLIGSWLMSFLMPMFFITSGFWMKKKKVKAGLADSVRYLLKPYGYTITAILAVSLLHRGAQGLWEEWVNVFLIPALLVSSGENTRIGAMWFVFALFLAWCAFYIGGMIKKEKLQAAFFVGMGVLGGMLLPMKLPFQIGQGSIAAFYLYCGYQLKKQRLLERKIPVPILLIMFACWVWEIVYGSMDLAFYDVRYGIFSIMGSLAGTFLIIRILLYFNKYDNWFMNMVRSVGRHTMWILCIHSVEAAVIPWKILFRFTGEDTWLRVLAQLILRALLIGVGCLALRRMQRFVTKKLKMSRQ